MLTSALYRNSPIFIQNLLISFRAFIRKILRENPEKLSRLDLIDNEYSINKLEVYGNKHLAIALNNALDNTKYYPMKIQKNRADLEQFPYLTKDELRNRPSDFLSKVKPKIVIKGSTSGTTGTPLSIPQSMDSVIREQAFVSRMLKWAGYEKDDKRAWIRGDLIVPIKQLPPPYWRYSWFENMIMLSSFHMTREALPLYIQAMVDYGVDIIQAYPSSIATLAKYLESKGEYYPGKIKSVITSSESLTPEDRQVIEERFRCKVFDWYGLFERVAAIANCEYGRYHVLTDYSYVEFLDVGNGRHEIVGTNFNNLYYPLIRYKTGDHVILSKEKECPCGRVYPMVERIEGRVGDYLVGENGQKVHILNHIPKGVKGLLACQFVQDSADCIQAVVVIDAEIFDNKQKSQLVTNIKERLGQNIIVVIKEVASIPRTKNGKIRQAICSL